MPAARYTWRGGRAMARSMPDEPTRRAFVTAAAGVGGALWLAGCSARDRDDEKAGERPASGAAGKTKEGDEEEEISPSEDLMREHGLLDRVLLVYEEGLRRLDAREDVPPSAFVGGAGIVRRFIEDYHEK